MRTRTCMWTRTSRPARPDNALEECSMAQRLPSVDAVTIGVGLTGSLSAFELVQFGLEVVGLERGAFRDTVPKFQSPAIHDELRFLIRTASIQGNLKCGVTFRNDSIRTALPVR